MSLNRRVLVFGNSGSGKSTLSKSLSEQEGLAHLDLDTLAWLPSIVDKAPPQRASLKESSKKLKAFTSEHEAWVIEGCYTDLLDLLSNQATDIIFMNLDTAKCIENAKNRPWEPHKYESKTAQDKNLDMLISWIEQYTTRDDVFSYQSHKSFYEGFAGNKIMYEVNTPVSTAPQKEPSL